MDYQIQPNSRRCAVTGRELQIGERYYSALLEEDRRLVRKDFSVEAWAGPPSGAFSFWTGRVHADADRIRPRFDDDLLEDCFQRLAGETDPRRVSFRYVVALLLLRRRRLRYESSRIVDGVETITLTHLGNGAKHEVINPRLSDNEMNEVQDEVFRVLGWK